MNVRLLQHTPNPDQFCDDIARIVKIKFKENVNENRSALKHCIECGHESVLEHAIFTFLIEDVSRVLTHELVRHRIASYTQSSTRLSTPTNELPISDYVKRQSVGDSSVTLQLITDHYNKSYELKKTLEDDGIPSDIARAVLPMGICADIVVTMNARSLRNFFKLRMCKRSYSEIQELANIMYTLVKEIAPMIFAVDYCAECKERTCEF